LPRLVLFGGISIMTDGAPVTGRAVQRRRLALLALLAAARARGMRRDKLVGFLWPDADAETGRHYLSDSVYRINQALGGDVITAGADDLRLDPQRLPSDLDEFEVALAAGDLERVAEIYTGPFLDGFVLPDAGELERWVESERARLAAAYARTLESLADAASRRKDPAASLAWSRRLAAHDPYNSRSALRLMHALRDAGETAAAIQHARVHSTLLERELEVPPDPAVLTFAEQLRSERPASSGTTSRAVNASTTGITREADSGAPVVAASRLASLPPAAGELVVHAAIRRPTWRHHPQRWIIGAVLAGVALTGFALWSRQRATLTPPPTTPIGSVAVLPFTNLSADQDNEYFSDGMTEELIAALGAVEGIAVASRTSAFAYKNRSVDVRTIGRELGVDAVVEGSVRKSGPTLRISAQLVSTANGYRLWSDRYDREVDDALAIQEEIARSIVARMTGSLLGSTVRPGQPTRNPDAYDLYLRGRFAWHQRTRDGLARAIEYFNQAVERAPEYARAHAGLADAYAVSAFYDYRAPTEAYPIAEASARRALEIDPASAAPHATLGYVLTYYHLDWSGAEAEFKRALAIDPNYSTAHQWYGNLLTVAGRFDEAEAELRLAQEADPLSLIANAALGWSFYYAGKYEAAFEQCRTTIALDPNYQLAHLWGGWALLAMGRAREARQWLDRAVELSRSSDLTRLGLAYLLASSAPPADRDSGRTILRAIEARGASGDYVPSYEIAKVHLALGDRAEALRWLDRTVEERSHSRAFLRVDPQLAPLRSDPRFQQLVGRTVATVKRR
jgi:TolB-like protein/DNA-binding SARP family transcriptional activator/Tfp pilus assembly protein PilF